MRRPFRSFLTTLSIPLLLTSCGDQHSQQQFAQIDQLVHEQHYIEALEQLQQMDDEYATDVEVRRQVQQNRRDTYQLYYRYQLDSLHQAILSIDSALVKHQSSLLEVPSSEATYPRYSTKHLCPSPKVTQSGFQAFVERGDLTLTAVYVGSRSLQTDGVRYTSDAGTYTVAPIVHDQASNYRYQAGGQSYEILTINGQKSAELLCHIAYDSLGKLQLLRGDLSVVTLPLSAVQVDEAKQLYTLYELNQNKRRCMLKGERIARLLDTSPSTTAEQAPQP